MDHTSQPVEISYPQLCEIFLIIVLRWILFPKFDMEHGVNFYLSEMELLGVGATVTYLQPYHMISVVH